MTALMIVLFPYLIKDNIICLSKQYIRVLRIYSIWEQMEKELKSIIVEPTRLQMLNSAIVVLMLQTLRYTLFLKTMQATSGLLFIKKEW